MGRRAFVGVRRGKPTAYDWEGQSTTSLALASGGITEAALFTGDRAETIRRIRGEVLVWLDASGSAASDKAIIGLGLLIAPTGATVAVDPITEPGANWMWHRFLNLGTEAIVGSTSDSGIGVFDRVEVDNKSMRKFKEDEQIFFVVSNLGVQGAPVVNVMGAFRVLAGH